MTFHRTSFRCSKMLLSLKIRENISMFILSGKYLKDHPQSKFILAIRKVLLECSGTYLFKKASMAEDSGVLNMIKTLSQTYGLPHMIVLSYNNFPSLFLFHMEI